MLAKARARVPSSRPSSASSAMSKTSQQLPQQGGGQGLGGGGGGGLDGDNHHHPHHHHPSHSHPSATAAGGGGTSKSRFEQYQDDVGHANGRASPMPPKHFTALAVLEIHPADDDGNHMNPLALSTHHQHSLSIHLSTLPMNPAQQTLSIHPHLR